MAVDLIAPPYPETTAPIFDGMAQHLRGVERAVTVIFTNGGTANA